MKKIFLLAATTLVMAACDNNEDNQTSSGEKAIITASIGESIVSRASDAQWADNDKIGITSIVGGKAGPFINLEYAIADKDAGTFTGTPIFFYKPMTLTAYYPFTGDEGELPGTDGIITATTDPDNQAADKQPEIDFLWDSRTGVDKKDFSVSNPNVKFVFAHKMSKFSFTFISSDPTYDETKTPPLQVSEGVDVNTMISYRIEGLGIAGTFDTATGVCAIDETKDREGLEITFDKNIVDENAAEIPKTRSFPSLIVFPQTNDAGYTLHVTTDEFSDGRPTQNYKCALRFTDNEIKAGNHYKFKIQVTKRGLIVGELSIEPWIEADEKFITATIDGSVKDTPQE